MRGFSGSAGNVSEERNSKCRQEGVILERGSCAEKGSSRCSSHVKSRICRITELLRLLRLVAIVEAPLEIIQPDSQSSIRYSRLPRTTSSLFLNIPKDEDSTAFLSYLF